MGIKTRVDGLSEADAKAALAGVLHMYWRSHPCWCCLLEEGCTCHRLIDSCKQRVLDEALKEARK